MTYCRWTLLIHLRKYPRALMQGGRPAKLARKHSCFSLFTVTITFFLLNSSPKKTATRKNHFHEGAAETSGWAVRQNKISWHLHERGNRPENKFARKSSTGENTVFEAQGGGGGVAAIDRAIDLFCKINFVCTPSIQEPLTWIYSNAIANKWL